MGLVTQGFNKTKPITNVYLRNVNERILFIKFFITTSEESIQENKNEYLYSLEKRIKKIIKIVRKYNGLLLRKEHVFEKGVLSIILFAGFHSEYVIDEFIFNLYELSKI